MKIVVWLCEDLVNSFWFLSQVCFWIYTKKNEPIRVIAVWFRNELPNECILWLSTISMSFVFLVVSCVSVSIFNGFQLYQDYYSTYYICLVVYYLNNFSYLHLVVHLFKSCICVTIHFCCFFFVLHFSYLHHLLNSVLNGNLLYYMRPIRQNNVVLTYHLIICKIYRSKWCF